MCLLIYLLAYFFVDISKKKKKIKTAVTVCQTSSHDPAESVPGKFRSLLSADKLRW